MIKAWNSNRTERHADPTTKLSPLPISTKGTFYFKPNPSVIFIFFFSYEETSIHLYAEESIAL